MTSRQEQLSGTRPVSDAHHIDEVRLHNYLLDHLDGYSGPLTLKQFKGGQSNPTYLVETSAASYVLRRKPPGQLLKSAHAVDREYRVISALYDAGFPVPRPYLLCEDESVTGTVFYVMEFVQGRIFWELDLPGLVREERAAIYDDINATIAELHSFDPERIGLTDFGKPGNYFARQVSRWSKQYEASETADIPAMNRLMAWLPKHIPGDDSSSIVHGDFRLDNLVIHPTEPRVIAVLDWELSTIGHPLADFTYHLMAWQMTRVAFGSEGLYGKDFDALGIPDEEEYVRRYCARVGRDPELANRDFCAAYNFFRLAAILQGIAGRVRDGTAASVHAEAAADAVAPLADIGWAYAERVASG